MALSIKDPEADELARRLAALTGETLTETVVKSLRERLARVQRTARARGRLERLRRLQTELARMPVVDGRPLAELVEYDDDGLPR